MGEDAVLETWETALLSHSGNFSLPRCVQHCTYCLVLHHLKGLEEPGRNSREAEGDVIYYRADGSHIEQAFVGKGDSLATL